MQDRKRQENRTVAPAMKPEADPAPPAATPADDDRCRERRRRVADDGLARAQRHPRGPALGHHPPAACARPPPPSATPSPRAGARPGARTTPAPAPSPSSPTRSPPTPGARCSSRRCRRTPGSTGSRSPPAVSHGDPELERALLRDLLAQPLVGLVYASILTRPVRPLPAFRTRQDRAPQLHRPRPLAPRGRPGRDPRRLRRHPPPDRRRPPPHRPHPRPVVDRPGPRPHPRLPPGARRAGHPLRPRPLLPGNWEPSSGYDGTVALLALADPPTAIFAASDMIALGVYDALKERGLRIPEDVSVVGYDDREVARFMRPALTTVGPAAYRHGPPGRRGARRRPDPPRPAPAADQGRVPPRRAHSVAPPRR